MKEKEIVRLKKLHKEMPNEKLIELLSEDRDDYEDGMYELIIEEAKKRNIAIPMQEKEINGTAKKCPFCSKRIQDKAVKCIHCKAWLPATQNKRLLNLFLDYGFTYVFAFILGGLLLVVGLWQALQMDKINESVLGILIALVYFVISETIWGKSFAKFITKTKVILKDGKKPKFGDIIIRTLCRFIPFDALSFLGSKNPIGWHDSLSKTIVIDDRGEKA